MTTLQRYRHLVVLDPDSGAGTQRYRPADRAALIRKALTLVYGEERVQDNIIHWTAVLHSDTQHFINEMRLDVGGVLDEGRNVHSRHAQRAVDQPLDSVTGN